MDKLTALKETVQGRVNWLTDRIDSGDFGTLNKKDDNKRNTNSLELLEYFVAKRRAYLIVLEDIETLEKM
jgi:hypothetical protein